MGNRITDTERRRLLALVGSGLATGLAGCSGGGGGGGEDTATATATETATATDTATPTSGGDDTVPSEYETATAIGGAQRNPDSLSSKSAVNYQSNPKDGQQCSSCQFYIEDKNGDGMGACTLVAGNIAPEGYCVSYAAYEG
ncbi:high-potential iron-sulfur protein [Haloplanus ruber]|uniref:High-potential iron-sulfur protein n=1 Tax=Haloplanus ruber TaxID=869892 RepID=A0ABD6D067_9EURY|nr:high-potential iron-sulfur protein [Haloplanus ruber]